MDSLNSISRAHQSYLTDLPSLPTQNAQNQSIEQLTQKIFNIIDDSSLKSTKKTALHQKFDKIIKENPDLNKCRDKILKNTSKIAKKDGINALQTVFENESLKTQNLLNVKPLSLAIHGNIHVFQHVSLNKTKKQAFDFLSENPKIKNPVLLYENSQFIIAYQTKEKLVVFSQVDPSKLESSIDDLYANHQLQSKTMIKMK